MESGLEKPGNPFINSGTIIIYDILVFDESGKFELYTGLPDKSSAGLDLVIIHPDKNYITVWCPKLNET